MNKKLIIALIIIVVIIVVGVFIYNGFNTNKVLSTNIENPVIETKKEKTIQIFKQSLEESGLKVTTETKKAGELIGAKEGYGFEINGDMIEIYDFDLKSTEELTKSNLKSAKEENKIYMPSFDNYSINAIRNDNLILAVYENHPNKNKIIEIFKSL